MTDRDESVRDEQLLHDYLDGELPKEEREALERRLNEELGLRRELKSLSAVTEMLGALPREAEAPGRIWEAVAEATGAPASQGDDPAVLSISAGTAGSTTAGRGYGWVRLAAAAVVLIALSSSVTWFFAESRFGTDEVPVASEPAMTASPDARFASHDAIEDYEASAYALSRILEEGGSVLAPETLEVVRESIATIDEAIAEAKAALANDPGSSTLNRILLSNMKKKLDLLRDAAAAIQSVA